MMVFRAMDTEVVINEVKKRECLWNPRCVFYKNKVDKYKAWEEVCEVVLPKFAACNEIEQGHIVRAVQSRWKTARDAYMKCRLTETKKPTYKSRQHKYIYQEQLRFLEAVKHMEEGKFRDDDDGSNGFVAENSTSQSAFEATDEDEGGGEEQHELMDFDIEIHDDFKDKIKEEVVDTESVPDKSVNDDIKQEAGTSTQENEQSTSEGNMQRTRKRPLNFRPRKTKTTMTEFETRLLKILRSKNKPGPIISTLQADDQFFFNSLASLLNNFDNHQKLKFRSKILEVVMDVGNIGSTTNVKQERDTYVIEYFEKN